MARQKFSLLPLRPESKIPYIELLPVNRQGQATWSEYTLRPASESEVKDWFLYDPNCNYGIITGPASGLYVLDVDLPFKLPRGRMRELPATVAVKTGRGYHYYFKYDGELKGQKFTFGELKGAGGYVVGPGSVHKNGQVYEFFEFLSPAEIEIAKLPGWIKSARPRGAAQPTTGRGPLKTPSNNLTSKDHKNRGVVRNNSVTCYTPVFEQLEKLNQDPETALKIMEVCGRKVDRIGKAFTCPLPGHGEKKPSAALYQEPGRPIVLNDFHEKDRGRFSWPLPDVYASCKVGKPLQLKKGERAIWWLRALHEIGQVNPPILKGYELPQEAPESARKLYKGFIYLMELRQLYAAQDAAPFSWSFASRWCGIRSAKYVQKAMRFLLERGFLYMKQPGVKIGEGEGPRSALFAIGRPRLND